MHAVQLLSRYPGLHPGFHKRTGGVLNACLLDRTVWGQCIIFQPKTGIIRRGLLASSASNCPASAFALRWERYRVIGAAAYFFAHAKKGADHTTPACLRQALYGEKCTSSHAVHPTVRTFPPSPSRETCCDVLVRPQHLSSAVFSCFITGGPLGPEGSLSWPSSSACRRYGQQAW